jgi:hypothetical protein
VSTYSPATFQERTRRRTSAGPALRGGVRDAFSGTSHWLYPAAPDVVTIQARPGSQASPESVSRPGTVHTQVGRWRRRVWLARAAVVLVRHLAVALALAIVGLAVARLATSQLAPLWAFAGSAVMLAAALVALWMPVTDALVAGMLDRQLGLFERVQTALELELINASSPLGRQVIAEAQQALGSSFTTSRARPRTTRLALLAAVVFAVGVTLLLVAPGSSQPRHSGATPGGARVGATSGTVHAHRAAPAKKRPAGVATLPVGAAVDNASRPPLAIAPSTSGAGKGGGASPYGNGAKSSGASTISKTGLSDATASTRVISAPGSASGLAGTKSSSSGATGAASSSSGANGAAKAGSGGLSAPGSAPSVRAGSLPKGAQAGGTPGAASSSGTGSQSGSQSQKAPPGGEQAGATRGSTQLQAGLAPDLAQGSSGLPLQAGYAPTDAKSAGHGGISQTPNGGGGKARSTTGGGASGGSGSTSGATAIEPTSNTSSASSAALLSNYFGASNQLKPGSW